MPVIVDGNNHDLKNAEGKNLIIQTEVTDNIVTLEKCRQLAEKIKQLGHVPKVLKIDLCIFGKRPEYEKWDYPQECLFDKVATYHVQDNHLLIREKGELVYSNDNGVICKDKIALADSF
ncbi:hypothetical protein KV564_26500 [Paenibacillus chitinolyticus]|nr:hypothetical protein [Paenibacillus chitinolyticus]